MPKCCNSFVLARTANSACEMLPELQPKAAKAKRYQVRIPQPGCPALCRFVTPLLVSTRDWLITGQATLLPGFLWVSAVTLALLFAGWVLYRIAMPHLISRMSA